MWLASSWYTASIPGICCASPKALMGDAAGCATLRARHSQGTRLNAFPPRIRSLLAAVLVLGALTAFLSSFVVWLPSNVNALASAPPNGEFATLRGVVRIESKIQPRGHAINFYSRRGGPAVPLKPAAPINELESV